MQKKQFERLLYGYYLNGLVPSVNLVSTEKHLSAYGISENRDVLSKAVYHWDDEPEVPVGTYGIYDTNKFLSLLSVLGDEIIIGTHLSSNKPVALNISDTEKRSITFALADPSVIPPTPRVAEMPLTELYIELDGPFMASFMKAAAAITDQPIFSIGQDGPNAVFTIGDLQGITHRVKLSVPLVGDIPGGFSTVYFSTKTCREILAVNKQTEGGTLMVSSKGIATFNFGDETAPTSYILIARERNQ